VTSPASTGTPAPAAGATAAAAVNKFASAIADVAEVVSPAVPGADLVAKAANAVASGS
jgi:hypothetical protein